MEYGYQHGVPAQRGDEIRMFQEKLNTIRVVYHGNWQQLTPDGIYGRKTRDAVKAFQVYMNATPSGNMDAYTQALIIMKHAESQQTYNAAQLYTSYIPPEPTAYACPAEEMSYQSGTLAFTDTPSSFPKTYDAPTYEEFKRDWLSFFTTIWDAIMSTVSAILESKRGDVVLKKVTELVDTIKSKVNGRIESIRKKFRGVKQISTTRAKNLMKLLDSAAEQGIKKAKPALEEASKTKAKGVAGKLGKAGWAKDFLRLFYYCIMCLTASTTEEEKEYNKKVRETLKSLVADLLSTLAGVIVQKLAGFLVGVAVKAGIGAAAGSAVPGLGTVVGAIVGAILAIADIFVLYFTDKSTGEWILEGIKSLDEWLGFSDAVVGFLNEYIGENQFAEVYRPGWDLVPGEY